MVVAELFKTGNVALRKDSDVRDRALQNINVPKSASTVAGGKVFLTTIRPLAIHFEILTQIANV